MWKALCQDIKDNFIYPYEHMTHDNSYMQKIILTSSIGAHVNLTIAQVSICKPWSNPLEDNEMQLMGCFLPAL